jgi:probable phosphoglycerate mutase
MVGGGSGGVTRVLLVRHGQSRWNAEGRWQGQADPPLSPLGEEQARTAAHHVGPFDAIWASDLERARRTAEYLAAPAGHAVRVDARFRERDAGEWTGLTRIEIEERFPGHLESRRRPPAFETEDSVVGRALAALHEVVAGLDGGTGIVVTHGGVVLALERHLGGDAGILSNLAGRWFEHGPRGLVLARRVLLLDPAEVDVTRPTQL